MQNKRILLGILTVLLIINTYIFIPPIFNGDASSAVYLLNTIVTSLSTIFALSLSLIMVAIQLSAGKYSSRIFDFFLRFSLNIPVVMIFLTAILHSTFILAQVKVGGGTAKLAILSRGISFDVALMVYGFVILLIYVVSVIEMLKPENIVEMLKKEVYDNLEKKRIREAIYHIERLSDVAKKTTAEMDSVTAVLCIRAIAGTTHKISFENVDQQHWYIEHIIANLRGVATVAFNEKEHAIAEVIIEELTNLAYLSIKQGNFHTPEHIVETFSVIVSGSLVGQKQLMIIQKIMKHIEQITLQATSVASNNPQAVALITKVFKTMNFLGKQIIGSEPYGVTFVAKYMVTGGLGTILETIGEKRCDKIIPDIFYEYVDLITRVMREGETKNIITITTWMRNQLLAKDVDAGKLFLFLKTYLCMAAVAIYLKRFDKASLIIKALGKYYPPDGEILQELHAEQLVVRHFFDYHLPDKYLKEAYYVWGIYNQACKTINATTNKKLSSDDVYQDMDKWESLFDGLSVDDLFAEDEIPRDIEEEIFTAEDIE